MSATFIRSTIEQILAEIRSIANAADFGTFVAKRRAENVEITRQTRRNWHFEDPETFFPSDPESSMLDALLEKICDLAPLTLPKESISSQGEHPWLECIRECASKSACFMNKESPRYVDVNGRVVDVLISCFADLEHKSSKNGATGFLLVTVTLSRVLGSRENNSPLVTCGASDALIDFLMQGDDKSQEFLVRAIFRSSTAGKWIAQIAEKNPHDEILDAMRLAIYECETAPAKFFDPEQLRLCFRTWHVLKNKSCRNGLGSVIEAIFDCTHPVWSKFLNAPLNLPDDNGNIIEDTPLSIACDRTRYCARRSSKFLCTELVNDGANVNGLIDDPTDPTKKIVSRRDGKTPLMIACVSGHDETVELLLKNKDLDVSLKDNEGKSAVNYLLRRFECPKHFLELLHQRDPVLFESHVSIADLDFAVRNSLEASVTFLFSLKNVHFDTAELQAPFDFSLDELLAIRSQATAKFNDGSSNENIYCKQCGYDGPNPDGRLKNRKLREPSKTPVEMFSVTCIRGLSERLHAAGCTGISVSLTCRHDGTPSSDNKNEAKERLARRSANDDDSNPQDDSSDDEEK